MNEPGRKLPRQSCTCKGVDFGSYEAQVELVAPPALTRSDGRGIGVDVCLALELSHLWKAGVVTTGSCCGHGRLEPTFCVRPESIEAMRGLGYQTSPLAGDRPDIFTARTGWPV